MKVSSAKRNSARAQQGAWVSDIPGLPGVRFHVLGFGCAEDKEAQKRELEKLPRYQQRRGTFNEAQQRVLMNARIKALLRGWEGLTEDDETTPWPFNEQNVTVILEDRDYDMLREGMVFAIADVAEDQAESAGADAKN
jgi:hypothetical protein